MTRLAAPAAVLLAATVVLLLVRPLLRGEEAAPSSATATPRPTQPQPRVARQPARSVAHSPTEDQAFYEIRAGDTLGAVADRHETTVETLVDLNPGVDPTALQVGQRIRVK